MTIIAGLICNGAIVFASDSQTTDGYVKQCDTEKIFPLQFKNCQALVAASGMSSLSNHAVDVFNKIAEGVEIKADDGIAQLAKEAIFEVRKTQIAIYAHQYSLDQWQKFFRDDNPAELTVGYWFKEKPYLWRVNLHECVPIKSRCGYITSGVGGPLADYLLKEHFVADAEPAAGAAIAAFVVDKVIENNSTCGHPIRIAYLKKSPDPNTQAKAEKFMSNLKHWPDFPLSELRDNVFILSENDVSEITKELRRIDAEIKAARNSNIQKSLVIIARGMFKRMIEGRIEMKSGASATLTDASNPKPADKP